MQLYSVAHMEPLSSDTERSYSCIYRFCNAAIDFCRDTGRRRRRFSHKLSSLWRVFALVHEHLYHVQVHQLCQGLEACYSWAEHGALTLVFLHLSSCHDINHINNSSTDCRSALDVFMCVCFSLCRFSVSSSSLLPNAATCQSLVTSQASSEDSSCSSCWRTRRCQCSYSLPVRWVGHVLLFLSDGWEFIMESEGSVFYILVVNKNN